MDKKEFFEARLATGHAFLHVDARAPGVRVPKQFSDDPHLVLQYGLQMKIPIRDLAVTQWGVRGTLSFSRVPFATGIPWSAIYAIHGDDGEAYVWREEVPADIGAKEAEQTQEVVEKPPLASAKAGTRRHLKLVD